ncbi:hypothetical protein ACQKEN_17235 [Pseudomonas sp. NPDC078416]|uniref:hypothetical protein n=1 Tax=Pseudomonas sp. NPDC078416 TaxID=3390637 RepID=UPI003D03339E
MKIILICCAAALIGYGISISVAFTLAGCWDMLINAYQTSIRGYMFAAFLGASSFLISLLTFLVTNIKEKMFDSADYLRVYVSHNKLKKGDYISKRKLYSPLRLIGMLLVCAIFTSILCSVSQLTLGFSSNKYILFIPTFTPFLAVSFLISALSQIHSLIRQWLDSGSDVIKVSEEHL